MSGTANAHRLCPAGKVAPGIEGATIKSLRVGPQNDPRHRVLDFRQHDDSFPRTGNGLLLEGAPYEFDGRQAIVGRGSWAGALLSVSTFALEFESDAGSHFPGVQNAWPGAETLHPAVVQVGGRSIVDQHQLISVAHGKFVIVADRNKRYIRVDCAEGQLSVRPARPIELAQLLKSRAELFQMDNFHALEWTRHTLENLGMRQCWTPALERRRKELGHTMLSSARC